VTSNDTDIFVGWGNNNGTGAIHLRPSNIKEVGALVEGSSMCIARGLGRAYGDAAQCAGGTVIDCTGMTEILAFDVRTGVVRVEAGSINSRATASRADGSFRSPPVPHS